MEQTEKKVSDKVHKKGIQVLGSVNKLNEWLNRSTECLGGKKPINASEDEQLLLLERLEQSIYN